MKKGRGRKCIRYYKSAEVARLPDDEAERAVQSKAAFYISKSEYKLAQKALAERGHRQ